MNRAILLVEDGVRSEHVLKAGSAEADRFAKWVDANAKGWHVYYATTPSNGIFVGSRLGSLQFSRSGVIALRHEGQYWKVVSADVYELLRGDAGT